MEIYNRSQAQEFVQSYGFDPTLEKDKKKIHAAIVESLSFIERFLMPDEWQSGKKPPKAILDNTDICQLLLWASSSSPKEAVHQAWSCALLRVMHTIAHLEGVQKKADIDQAREQIMSKFQEKIKRDPEQRMWLTDGHQRAEILKVEWKRRKSRDSVILKLLHKPANVAETIYDFLGIRIITKRLSDTLLVLRFLHDFHLTSFPNNIPSRARNTLLSVF